MAELKVVSFCEYLTDRDAWQAVEHQDTYRAAKFVQAIKGEKVKGYAEIPVPLPSSGRRRLTDENKAEAFDWFGEMVAAHAKFATPLRLVPIPSSSATSAADVKKSGTYKLAQAIAARFKNATVAPVLWWRESITSARKGGPRDPGVLFPLLVLAPKTSVDPRCFLVDDVKTTCGHLQAAEARLRSVGIKVAAAICAARSVHVEGDHAFSKETETYPLYELPEDDEDAA